MEKRRTCVDARGGITRRILRKTQIGIYLVLLATVTVHANGFSQEAKVTLNMKQCSMLDIISELRKMFDYQFLYKVDDLKKYDKQDLQVRDAGVKEVMDNLLRGTTLAWRLEDQVILIRNAAVDSVKKEVQGRLIRGKVTDAGGVVLPGVTIMLKGTTIGTATDAGGQFRLEIPNIKDLILHFSFVGMKPKDVRVAEKVDTLTVVLEDEVSDLDQVTVIAYGTRKKRELISAVSSIKADDIKEVPSASLETLLQGRMAGVGVNQQSGSPGGGGTNVAVRGYNSLMIDESTDGSPLYVIDGVPVHSFTSPVTGTNTIAEIDPSTIESVEVLKDAASAAIYGSRAANGVILITTKKGRAGEGKFSANFSYSASMLPEAPDQLGGRGERLYHIALQRALRSAYEVKGKGYYKYPTSYEEAASHSADYDAFWNGGTGVGVIKVLQDSLNPFFNNSTNWYKYIFRTGKILNANLQTSGGSDRMTYLVGAGYYKETGIMPGSDFARVNLLSNLSFTPVHQLSVDCRFYLAYTDRSRGTSASSFGESFKVEGLTVDPQYTSSLLSTGGAVEEKMLQRLNGQVEDNTSYRLRTNLVLAYEIVKGLSLSTSVALDYSQGNRNQFTPTYLNPTYKETKSLGEITRDLLVSNENLLTYTFSIKEKHNFDLLLGLAYDASKSWSNSGSGSGGPSDNIWYVGSGFPDLIYDPKIDDYRAMKDYKSDFTETVMVSYFGRLAYNYDKKYLTEITVRRDGSSVFGAENRWATFPSVALGWAFSDEPFMKWAWWLNFGKIRASWGRSGSQFGLPYLAQGMMSPGIIFDGTQGMQPEGVINRELKWEESDQYDIGLDMDFFNYRLNVTLDYYYKYTRSLIYKVPLPGDMYGFNGVQWRNAMAISNEGLELDMKCDILREGPVSWRARLNVSRNWNRFRKSYTGVDLYDKVIGKPLSGIYLYKAEEIIGNEGEIPYVYDEAGKKQYLSPDGDEEHSFTKGMLRLTDVDGDGQITEDDMVYSGSALPVVYGGFVNEIKWKNFDLNILLNYSLGRKMVNAFSRSTLLGRLGGYPVFADVSLSDFWQEGGADSKYQSMQVYTNSSLITMTTLTDALLERVNYCKLKQLTIGYNVPKKLTQKMHIDGIRLFATGENLFTWTNYSGIDPEVVDIMTGIDSGGAYPLARKWTFGITVNF